MEPDFKIAIIDDHPVLRSGLTGALSSSGFNVALQTGQSNALFDFLANGNSLDLLLLDYDLGVENGLNILSKIKNGKWKFPVVLFSHIDDWQIIQKALDGGASGFLSKQESVQTIAVMLHSILQGVSPVLSPILQVVMRKTIDRKTPLDQLSARELEVLRLLVSGYKYKDIAEDLAVSRRTVEYHAQSVREKLEVDNLVDLVRIADKYLPNDFETR